MQGLHVLLLGQGRIELDGQALTRLLAPKQQALVYYLAATGAPATRARLATLLWGERDEAAARTSLRGALSRLRRWLPGVLSADGDEIGFAPGAAVHVDWQALARALAPDAPPAQRLAASAAWRGPLLDGFDAGGAEAFEDWLAQARSRARQDIQALRTGLLHAAEQAGDAEGAIRQARALLEIDDADEPAHMALMRALAATGRRTAAIAQYEACRAALAERLGARPSAECYALYTRIHADAPPAVPRRPDAAPGSGPDRPRLLGRETEQALADERLSDPACSWLTIVGPGGVGKSCLAQALAAARSGRYRHGVLRLGGRDDAQGALQDAEHLAQHVIDRTGADRERPGALLLVLDELEQLPAGRSFAALLRTRAPGVQVLATSRARLGDPHEWLLELQGLGVERRRADDPLSSPAAALFTALARRRLPGFDPAAEPGLADAVERLVQALGGLPLALALAARSAFDGGVAAVLARLGQGQWPADADRGTQDRHRSLALVLEEAWARLDAPARDAALRLARLPAAFDDTLAQTVGVAAGALAALRAQSWLLPDAADAGRLRFHPLQQAWLRAREGADALDAPVHDAIVRQLAARMPPAPPFGDPAGDRGRDEARQLAATPLGAAPVLAAAARHQATTAQAPSSAGWFDRAAAMLSAAGRPAEAAALLVEALGRPDLPAWQSAGWWLRRAELLNDGGASGAALASYLRGFERLGLGDAAMPQSPWRGLAGAAARVMSLAHWPPAGHPARAAFGDLLVRSLVYAAVMLAFTPDPRPTLRLSLLTDLLTRRTGRAGWMRPQLAANGLAMAGQPAMARRLLARAGRAQASAGAATGAGIDPRLAAMMDEGQGVLRIALGDWGGQVPAIDATADTYARLGCGRHETETRALAAKLLFYEGRLRDARQRFVELSELALRRPGESWRAWGPMGLAEVELCLGEADLGRLQGLADRASGVMTEMENVDAAYTLRRWGLAARLAWRRGDIAGASEAVQAGIAAATRMRSGWWSHEGHAGLGDTLLALWRHELATGGAAGPLADAWRRYTPALGRHVRVFTPAALLWERLHGEQAMLAGHRDIGLARLERAVALGERQGMRVELARACDALAAARADGGWPRRADRLWAALRG